MFIEERVENRNKSVMNDSHGDKVPQHLMLNEGSKVVPEQRGDSDHSETTEEINSTNEQGEGSSEISESEYTEESTVATDNEQTNIIRRGTDSRSVRGELRTDPSCREKSPLY
jgi:hypothetical protein